MLTKAPLSFVLLLIGMLILAGCAMPPLSEMNLPPLATLPAAQEPAGEAPREEPRSMPSLVDLLVDRAKRDLAVQQNTNADAVTLVSAEYRDWPDSALGCPRPGMMYAQVITPGYLITLEHDGATYEYHTDTNPEGMMVLCSASR